MRRWSGAGCTPTNTRRYLAVKKREAQARASRSRRSSVPAVLVRIRGCESGHNYRAENSHSTASGAYQFLSGTWRATTGSPPPASAYSPAVQDAAAVKLYRQQGTRPWNASRHCWG